MTTPIDLPFSFQHMSLPGGVRAAMLRNPEKIALKHHDQEISYRDFVSRIDRVCSALLSKHGLQHGDHAAIVSANSIEYLEIVLGASQAGVGTATINPRLSTTEIVSIANDARARVLFVDKPGREALAGARFDTVEQILTIGSDYQEWRDSSEPMEPLPVVEEWDTFTIPYTSGTTGQPKGVLVPHRSRVISLYAMAVEYGCFSPDDRFLAIAPMCHGAGMIFALAPVFFGGYAEIMDKFDPEAVVQKFRDEQITGFFGVPTHFHAIFGLDPKILEECRSDSLHTIISNAAALPQVMKEKIITHFGQILHETYGSTEASIVANLRPADQLRKSACVGQPFPGTRVEIRREDGSECDAEEIGELFATSSCLFNGYWMKPDQTAEAFQEGWVTVGDLAKKDAEGHIYIVDRIKDMVISGGINIYPREIEEVLIQHEQISDAAVIGVPDEKWGERLRAFIVTVSGAELNDEAIISFCDGRISNMKTPRDYAYIDALPRNASGKVLKTELRTL